MIALCSNCKTKFNIPDAKIPDKGARVRCTKCKEYFVVKKGTKPAKKTKRTVVENATEPPPPPPPPRQEKPPPSLPAKNGDTKNLEEDSPTVPHEECKRGAPAWIMTFADLATLMLTFFVLLLSFANMDIVKFKDMLGSVQDAFGVTKKVKGEFQSVLKGEDADKETMPSSADKAKAKADEEKAKEELERQNMSQKIEGAAKEINKSKNIDVSIGAHGVKVRIKGNFFFNPGSSILRKESLQFLNSISQIMEEFPFKLIVEGHTDSIPISTAQFPSNWELSAVRATTVLRYFVEQKGIDSSRLSAIGYAANKPIASNEKAEGRAQNRRVEFVFSKK